MIQPRPKHPKAIERPAAVRGIGETSAGLKRRENQDSILVLESETVCLYAVADGMGGVQGGAHASRLAIAVLEDFVRAQTTWNQHTLEEAFLAAHHRIRQESLQNAGLAKMGTTLTCLAFVGEAAYWASVGDSRCYFVRCAAATSLTDDHTVAADLVRAGALTPQQVAPGPLSHMLTQSLGGEEGIVVDSWMAQTSFQQGDRFVLCSDGLHNLLADHDIAALVSGAPAASSVHALICLANERGGDDNISAIVVEAGPKLADSARQPLPGFSPQRIAPLYPERVSVTAATSEAPLVDRGADYTRGSHQRMLEASIVHIGILQGIALLLLVFLLGLMVGASAPQVRFPLLGHAVSTPRTSR